MRSILDLNGMIMNTIQELYHWKITFLSSRPCSAELSLDEWEPMQQKCWWQARDVCCA